MEHSDYNHATFEIIEQTVCKFTYHCPLTDHEFFDLLCLRFIDHREVSKLLVVLCWQIEAEVVEIEYVFGLLVEFLLGFDHDILFSCWLRLFIVQDIHEGVLEYVIRSIFFPGLDSLVLCSLSQILGPLKFIRFNRSLRDGQLQQLLVSFTFLFLSFESKIEWIFTRRKVWPLKDTLAQIFVLLLDELVQFLALMHSLLEELLSLEVSLPAFLFKCQSPDFLPDCLD